MKHGHALAIGMLALALAACGGSHHSSNGGDGGVTDPGLGLTADYRIEAVLSAPTVDPGYLYQDPQNIEILDNVTFQLVSYTGSGAGLVRNVVPTSASVGDTGVTFATNDTLKASGGLSTTDGIFTASGSDSGVNRYVVTATYLGQNYSAYYRINPRLNQVRVHGKVQDETGVGVYNAEIDFYAQRTAANTTQVVVDTVRTGADGTFRASVPYAAFAPVIRYVVRPPDGYSGSFSGPSSATDYSVVTAGSPFPAITTQTFSTDPSINLGSLTQAQIAGVTDDSGNVTTASILPALPTSTIVGTPGALPSGGGDYYLPQPITVTSNSKGHPAIARRK